MTTSPHISTLRRRAKRDGYCVRTYRRGPFAGSFYIVDAANRAMAAGWDGFDLADVAEWLRPEESRCLERAEAGRVR